MKLTRLHVAILSTLIDHTCTMRFTDLAFDVCGERPSTPQGIGRAVSTLEGAKYVRTFRSWDNEHSVEITEAGATAWAARRCAKCRLPYSDDVHHGVKDVLNGHEFMEREAMQEQGERRIDAFLTGFRSALGERALRRREREK